MTPLVANFVVWVWKEKYSSGGMDPDQVLSWGAMVLQAEQVPCSSETEGLSSWPDSGNWHRKTEQKPNEKKQGSIIAPEWEWAWAPGCSQGMCAPEYPSSERSSNARTLHEQNPGSRSAPCHPLSWVPLWDTICTAKHCKLGVTWWMRRGAASIPAASDLVYFLMRWGLARGGGESRVWSFGLSLSPSVAKTVAFTDKQRLNIRKRKMQFNRIEET